MKILISLIFGLIAMFCFSCESHAQATSVCVGSTAYLGSGSGGVWSSSNTFVATVDSDAGVVSGISAGTAIITGLVGSALTTFSVTVNAMPALTSALATGVIPDSTIFNYTPMSTVSGTAFTWYRPYIPGIYASSDAGSGNPYEQLINTTYVPVTVAFIYGLSASGCSDTQIVTVIVDPTPMLSSSLTPAHVLDTFIYHPASYTPGAGYSWNRPAIAGISPVASFGTDSVHEVLQNLTSSPITVTYDFQLSIGSVTNTFSQPVRVVVEPLSSMEANQIVNNTGTIKIYPNPAHNAFSLDLPDHPNHASITISDILGKVIETRNVKGGSGIKEIFNAEGFLPGNYIVKVVVDGQTYRDKLVVW